MLLSIFPLAYTTKGKGSYGSTGMLRVRVREDAPFPAATYGHERFHFGWNWRHPIATHTAKGDEVNEAIGNAVGAILMTRYHYRNPGERWTLDNAIKDCAFRSAGSGAYREKGMWPEVYAFHPENTNPDADLVAVGMLVDIFYARVAEAEAWIAKHIKQIDRVAAKMGYAPLS